eukprot:1150553-Pelagomonas_calceolata.AAC.11
MLAQHVAHQTWSREAMGVKFQASGGKVVTFEVKFVDNNMRPNPRNFRLKCGLNQEKRSKKANSLPVFHSIPTHGYSTRVTGLSVKFAVAFELLRLQRAFVTLSVHLYQETSVARLPNFNFRAKRAAVP